mmetsp:Transcript_22739/g.51447  ORF Transcript_22739/g.51447 Transcript_22739/m.51447 type:complete len:139 (-) Transcript_22739:209-625(-)
MHSCWTYWGHSGAPLFDERGHVCGLHSSWDDKNGARHGQTLACLQSVITAAGKAAFKGVKGNGAGKAKAKVSASATRGKGQKRAVGSESVDTTVELAADKEPDSGHTDKDEDAEEEECAPLAQRVQARLAAESKRARA